MPLADLLNNFNGLPTHALLVHFVVVISSLGAIAGIAYAVVPRFRRWLSFPLLAVGAASIVLGIITPSSGEKLEARVEPSKLLEKHTELGGQLGTIMIVYGILLVLTMLVVRFRSRGAATTTDEASVASPTAVDRIGGHPGHVLRAFPAQAPIAAGLTVLVLIGSVVSGIWVYRTGEAGARSVWDDTPATAPAGHGGDQSR
jgi:uncharacterized membrane protein